MLMLSEPGIEPGTPGTASWCVTSKSPRQLNVATEVNMQLFNCFNVMGRNINKQNQI